MSVKINTLWNIAGSALPLLVALITIPLLLRGMGNELFGFLTLLWVLIGYISLFDLGIGRSLTYEISKLSTEASSNKHKINSTFYAGMLLTATTGLVGAATLYFLAPVMAKTLLKVTPIYQEEVADAIRYCAFATIPTTITAGIRGTLEGFNKFASSNFSKLILGFGMFILPELILLIFGNHLDLMGFALLLLRFVVLIIAILQIRKLVSFREISIKCSDLRRLFGYGFWITISGIIGPLMIYGDRFIVTAIIGASYLPQFTIPQEGLQRLLLIPTAIASALLPRFSILTGEQTKQIYRKYILLVALSMFIVCTAAVAMSKPLLAIWIGNDFAVAAWPIVICLSIGIWFNSVAQIPYMLLHSKGFTKVTAIFHFIELILYLPMVFLLINTFGLIGAAISWSLRTILDTILLYVAGDKVIRVQ